MDGEGHRAHVRASRGEKWRECSAARDCDGSMRAKSGSPYPRTRPVSSSPDQSTAARHSVDALHRRVRHAYHLRAPHVQRVPSPPRARAPEAAFRDVADVVEGRPAPIDDPSSQRKSWFNPRADRPGECAPKLRLPRGYPVRLRRRVVRDGARRAQGHVQHDLQGERPGPRLGRGPLRRAPQDRRRQGAHDALLRHRQGDARAVQVAVAGGHGGATRVDKVHAPAQDGPLPGGCGVRQASAEAGGETTGRGSVGRGRQSGGVLNVKRKSR